MRTLLAAAVLVAAVSGSLAFSQDRDPERLKDHQGCQVRLDMRELWEEHNVYMRQHVVSTLGGLADDKAVTRRLVKNQDEIGDAMKPYYGPDAARKLSALLREHVDIGAEVVKAAKAGTREELQTQRTRWESNGKNIASHLGGLNPLWKRKAFEETMQMHMTLTLDSVECRLKKDWDGDIKAFDKGHEHLLKLADILTEGIVRQNGEKLKG